MVSIVTMLLVIEQRVPARQQHGVGRYAGQAQGEFDRLGHARRIVDGVVRLRVTGPTSLADENGALYGSSRACPHSKGPWPAALATWHAPCRHVTPMAEERGSCCAPIGSPEREVVTVTSAAP